MLLQTILVDPGTRKYQRKIFFILDNRRTIQYIERFELLDSNKNTIFIYARISFSWTDEKYSQFVEEHVATRSVFKVINTFLRLNV